jgi:hypothetical protein
MLNFAQVMGIIGFALIIWGGLCNLSAFMIFVFNKQINSIPSMRYLAFISIFDTLSLFVWNLNHFLKPNFNMIPIETWSVFNCKFLPFLQYSSLQVGGLLYSILSVDRYFSVFSLPGSFFSKLPFGTKKYATIWSLVIIGTVYAINLHLMILMGYYENTTQNVTVTVNGTNITELETTERLICFASTAYPGPLGFIESGGTTGNMAPMWDYANMAIYNFLPFVIMLIFNSLLIQATFDLHGKRNDHGSVQYVVANRRKQKLTVSLLVITFSFLLLTLPSTIVFGFFMRALIGDNVGKALLSTVDCLA